jgi:hypothetical protein
MLEQTQDPAKKPESEWVSDEIMKPDEIRKANVSVADYWF